MGSFCISCCATNQVIADDDMCQVVPVLQQSTFRPVELTRGDAKFSLYGVANSTCYPGCFWEPKGAFISAKYADYGQVEPNDTPANRRAMVQFFLELIHNAPTVAQGENPSHDVPFDISALITDQAPCFAEVLKSVRRYDVPAVDTLQFSELTAIWDYVWDVAREHRLFLCDYKGVPRPLQFAAFHQETVDQLVQHTNALTTWEKVSLELSSYLRHLVDELVKECAAGPESKLTKRFILCDRMREKLNLNMSDSVQGLTRPFAQDAAELLERHLDQGLSFDAYVEAMRPLMTGVYALYAMNGLNLKFGPILYAGQDYDNSQGKAYAKFVAGVAKAVTKQRKKRYE